MQDSKLYSHNNNMQRCDAAEVIEEFSKYFEWKFDGSDTLLDVGCGPGDVLCEIVLPKVPRNVKRVLGIDISSEMVSSAKRNFQDNVVDFTKIDISSAACCKQLNEQFDNITSFYCLHWIQNQIQTFANIHKLLRPNGTALIAFLSHTPLYDIYLKLSKFNKYKRFMKDVSRFISPYHNEKRPLQVVEQYCDDAGLSVKHLELREQVYVFESTEELRGAISAVNPFASRMPEILKNSFINDCIKLALQNPENRSINNGKIISRNQMIIAVLIRKSNKSKS